MLSYVKQQKKIARLLSELSDYSQFGKPFLLKETDEKLNFWSKLLFAYGTIGVFLYSFVKVAKIPSCQKMNEEKGLHEVCGLITSFWYPFDVTHFPIYHILYLCTVTMAQLLSKLASTITYTVLEIGVHIILRINHLNKMLEQVFDDSTYEVAEKRLFKCITYHNQIIDFATRFDSCIADGMFAHLTVTATIFGCIENQILTTMQFEGIIHFVGWLCALFVGCLGGQLLSDASLTVSEAVYNSKWYRVHPKLQKNLILMMARAQKPLFFRAGPFGKLSLPLFVSVMKTSYSILTLLKP